MPGPVSQLTVQQRLEQWAGRWPLLTPASLTLALMLLMALPVWPAGAWAPQLGLLSVLYWSAHQPRGLPLWATFVLGCVQDLWMGAPLGPSALVWLALRASIASQLVIYQARPFRFEWMVALPMIALAQTGLWLLYDFVEPGPLRLTDFMVQAGVSWLCYPLVAGVQGRTWTWALERRFG